jgi:hypothetical protein
MREHAVTLALTISFQRYPYPPSGRIETLPKSRGALPFSLAAPNHLVLPCPPGEAFWIGLIATPQGPSSLVEAVATLHSGEQVDLTTGTALAAGPHRGAIVVPPRFAVEGIAAADGGWWALALDARATPAPSCAGLRLLVRTGPPVAAVPPTDRAGPRPQHDLSGPAGHRSPPTGAGEPSGPPTVVRVDLTDPAGFESIGGERLPDALDDDATYGDWRLP